MTLRCDSDPSRTFRPELSLNSWCRPPHSEGSLLALDLELFRKMTEAESRIIQWLSRDSDKLLKSDLSLPLDDDTVRKLIEIFSRIAINNPIPLFKALLLSETMQSRVECPECGGSGKFEGRWDCLFCREPDHTIANYELAIRGLGSDS